MPIKARPLGLIAIALPAAATAQQPQEADLGDPGRIIVTGERVARTASETASSVALFTADDMQETSADRLDQLLALVPNVQLGSGEEGPAIRGQDSTGQLRNLFAFLGGARPRVTLQVDGRPVSFYEFVSGTQSAWDVAQIEVFRSPQTTTQGRNSIAGAIFVTTGQPKDDWEASGRLILGDAKTRQVSAMVTGPVVKDELALRVSGDLRLARVSSDMTDGIVGADIDRDDYGTARVKLAYRPSGLPGAMLETTFAYTRSQSPQFEGVSAPFRERRLPIPNQMIGVMKVEATSLTAHAEYDAGSGLTATITSSYGDAVLRRFALPGLGAARADTQDFSIEPTLKWEIDDRISLLLGVNRLNANQHQFIDISAFGIGTGSFDDEQDSLGVFGEATLRPAARLSVTGGLRYQRDRQVRIGSIGFIGLAYDGSFDAWLPKLSGTYELSRHLSAGFLVQRAYNPGGTTISLAQQQADTFGAEWLWDYELFLRGTSGDGQTTFTANAFYNDIENAQRPRLVPVTLPNGFTFVTTDFANAPKARSYGFEGQVDWRATTSLRVGVGLGLLRTKVVRTMDPGDATVGKSFQRSPTFTATGSIEWKPVRELDLAAQIHHQSGYFSDDANTPSLRIGSSTVVDGRINYRLGSMTLFGYARNLFDSFYMTYLFSPTFGSAGKPREAGIGLEARF